MNIIFCKIKKNINLQCIKDISNAISQQNPSEIVVV